MRIERYISEIEAAETTDPLLRRVADEVKSIVEGRAQAAGVTNLRIFVADLDRVDAAKKNKALYTDTCMSLTSASVVIVHEKFLLELEAALRSFGMSNALLDTPYLKSDEDMFGLVGLIKREPARYVARMRRLAPVEAANDVAAEELAMATLFFIGHEIGHLLDNKDQRHYGTFLKADAELEDKIANAVVKLCRHADEFEKYKFNLPGFDLVTDKGSDIRHAEEALRQDEEGKRLYVNHTKWFADEISADKTGEKIAIDYLDSLARQDASVAERRRYSMIRGLFGAAMYSWFKDLSTFCDKIGRLTDSRMLTLEMMKDRAQYIRAASLFGDVHRFTLLRATLAIGAILKGADEPAGGGQQTQSAETFADTSTDEEDSRSRLAESGQRHYLLRILMDTSVKISYVGCATGWMKAVDEERGFPQLLMMYFEHLGQAVGRLRDEIEKAGRQGDENGE